MWSELPCQSFESLTAMKAALPTPCALVDLAIVRSNMALLNERIQRLGSGVRFRPHVKTHKSADLARLQIEGHFGGITVSTIAEAKYFFARGFRDILYAVGMVGSKVARVADDIKAGMQLSVIVDHVDAVKAIASECVKHGVSLDVLIEVDCGYYRGGLNPASADLLDVGRAIHASSPSLRLRGVITHGGHSYNAKSVEALEAIANAERDSVVSAAQRLRDAGLPCEVTSIGSTPTATYLKDATGITELRAGVYVFQDLDQMGIGSCSSTSDIALTVLTAVIGHQPPAGKVLVDAGGLALSKDISAKQHCGYHAGYGWIIEHPEMHVAAVSQEHGHLKLRPSDDEEGTAVVDFTKYPIGATMRVVPNHSCFTAAAYDRYFAYVVNPDETVTVWTMERVNGW